MKTIKTEIFFKKIVTEYKTKYEDYHEKQINAFMKGFTKIKNKYFNLFGKDEIDFETFKENINNIQKWWWGDNTPFGMFSFKENEEFFEENCLGILDIYEEMREDNIDFELEYDGNQVYYNLNFHLQNYCFDFITRDFE